MVVGDAVVVVDSVVVVGDAVVDPVVVVGIYRAFFYMNYWDAQCLYYTAKTV